MKVRLVKTTWFPPRYAAITIYPFIFIRTTSRAWQNDQHELLRHEYVHIDQYRALGWFRFVFTYLAQLWQHGYADHPMEIEARKGE